MKYVWGSCRRLGYLFYYISKMDWEKFRKFSKFACERRKTNEIKFWIDAVICVFKYNIGLIDYFYFKFYEKSHSERAMWVGTGYKYEYDRVMNPVKQRHVLQNKLHFLETFAPFVKHSVCDIDELEKNEMLAQMVLNNTSGKVVLKDSLGQCGWGVEVRDVAELSHKDLVAYMKKKGFDLVEEYIVQHAELSRLSDSGLNTVRIVTQLNRQGNVEFIGPTLRVTINSDVDNMAVGNIAAPIDIDSGKVVGPGVYQDITKEPESVHPISHVPLVGFQVPYWQSTKELCIQAALFHTLNRSIGWDVAITDDGPSFVEGNHNWCKLLWQLPIGEGQKPVLDHYLKEFIRGKSTHASVASERL